MKVALITTTINVPSVLELYVTIAPLAGFRIFVAGDLKTPDPGNRFNDARNLITYLSPEQQKALLYKCDDLIGWNTIGRRNIALLEALKWGADVIISIDDDNIPFDENYFYYFGKLFAKPFHGCAVSGFNGWFDPGCLTGAHDDHTTPQRGFPHEQRGPWQVGHVVNQKIGVAQGLILGDPDTSAVERITNLPVIEHVTELARAGVVLSPSSWAPVNTQNVAFVRELAPCFLMVPAWQRYDDIFAGLIAQRVMRETGHALYFGQPFVWQQRNAHDLNKDLEQELWGMQNIINFAAHLDQLELESESIVERLHSIFGWLANSVFDRDNKLGNLALAWLEDVETVL